uniref:CUE domain-containing protein n=1 Tax=Kalanchoe fedtschenkoi TaxID=63787 RepID=A0A7N1A9F1_KALFE
MSAILCGKRSFFEDLSAAPPVSKRTRCSTYSPPSLIHQLAAIFPHMDKQVLEKALEACGNDLDSAIKSLNELHLGSVEKHVGSDAGEFWFSLLISFARSSECFPLVMEMLIL